MKNLDLPGVESWVASVPRDAVLAGTVGEVIKQTAVILAKAGIQTVFAARQVIAAKTNWIPARARLAGMTGSRTT